MAQLGMDPEQMGTLQKTMQREAGQIRTLAKQLDGQLKGAWWKGTDADRFRADWDGTHRTGLERIAAALEAPPLPCDDRCDSSTERGAPSTSGSIRRRPRRWASWPTSSPSGPATPVA